MSREGRVLLTLKPLLVPAVELHWVLLETQDGVEGEDVVGVNLP